MLSVQEKMHNYFQRIFRKVSDHDILHDLLLITGDNPFGSVLLSILSCEPVGMYSHAVVSDYTSSMSLQSRAIASGSTQQLIFFLMLGNCGDLVAWRFRRRTSMPEVVGSIPAQVRPRSNTLRQGMNP